MKQYEGRKMQLYHVMFMDIVSSLTFCGVQRVMDWAQKARLPKWDKESWSTLTPSVECHGAKYCQVISRDAKELPLHNSVHNPSQMEHLFSGIIMNLQSLHVSGEYRFRVAERSICHAYECTRFNHI